MLTVSRDDAHVIVTVHAPVDGQVLHRAIADLVEDQGNHSLRIEFRAPDFIDPVGTASLLRAATQLVSRGGHVELDGCAADLRVAVALILDPATVDADATGPDAAMQHLHRLALALHTVDAGEADALVTAAIGHLDDLVQMLRARAFRDATDNGSL